MNRPRKAIVLAAGFGSRLSPITRYCPKPLVPLRGKPILQHQLELLQSWGVNEVLVNVHHLAEKMVEALPKLCPEGLKLNISFEAEILGTGGGLRRMGWFLEEDPVWVCNADVLQQLDPAPLLRVWKQHQPLSCLWMLPDRGPRTVKIEAGRVIDFRGGGCTFSGLHLLNRRILNYLPDRSFSSVIEAYEAGMASGESICAVEVPDSEWADVGTPEQLLEANGGPVIFPGARTGSARKKSGIVVPPDWGLSSGEQRQLPEVVGVEILPARGSDRSFRRLYFPGHQEIFIRSGEARPENFRFAGHSRFLARRGIRVPRILKSRAQGRWLQVEDLGGEHLLDRLQSGSVRRNFKDMTSVLQQVAAFHALRIPPRLQLEPPFDAGLYAWEHKLFAEEYLARFGAGSEVRKLEKCRFRVSEILLAQPQVLVHRDLQSTNLMRVPEKDGGSWAFIDYQGMRRGAAAYDLGSLLADPYVNRPADLQLELLAQYNQRAEHPVSAAVYAAGAVQRLMQALGAFGRLGALKGNERFRAHIPAALAQLDLWTAELLKGQGVENPLRDESDE